MHSEGHKKAEFGNIVCVTKWPAWLGGSPMGLSWRITWHPSRDHGICLWSQRLCGWKYQPWGIQSTSRSHQPFTSRTYQSGLHNRVKRYKCRIHNCKISFWTTRCSSLWNIPNKMWFCKVLLRIYIYYIIYIYIYKKRLRLCLNNIYVPVS